MLSIRLPWLICAGAERFFIPQSEVEFYIGQSSKYLSIFFIMIVIMHRLGISFRSIGAWTTVRLSLSDVVHGGVFALFYILITWIMSIIFIPFVPEKTETVIFDIFYGYIIPVEKMQMLTSMLNPSAYAVYMTIVPAFIEEFYFRGFSITLLKNRFGNLWIVNFLQTILFSVLHWYRGLFAGIVPMFIFGFLFGFLTIRNDFRLTSAIAGHLIVNALSIFLYLRGLETVN